MFQPGDQVPAIVFDERLGSDGGIEEFRAHSGSDGRPLFVRFIPDTPLHSSKLARFEREQGISEAARHPGLARMESFGRMWDQKRGHFYMSVEPWVDGLSVEEILRAHGRRLDRELVVAITVEVLDVFDYIHGLNVMHRDLRPANVLVDVHGRVFVVGFLFAKEKGAERAFSTNTGPSLDPRYLAPEIFRDKDAAGPSSDLYSVGTVASEMLTGAPLFTRERALAYPAGKARPFIAAPLGANLVARWVDAMCSDAPTGRPPTARAARDLLLRCNAPAAPRAELAAFVARLMGRPVAPIPEASGAKAVILHVRDFTPGLFFDLENKELFFYGVPIPVHDGIGRKNFYMLAALARHQREMSHQEIGAEANRLGRDGNWDWGPANTQKAMSQARLRLCAAVDGKVPGLKIKPDDIAKATGEGGYVLVCPARFARPPRR